MLDRIDSKSRKRTQLRPIAILEDWLSRWEQGRTGWHEPGGNTALKKFWPELPAGSRVLVPLCGKSPDLVWLASRGLDVTGVELSPLAAQAFFSDNHLRFSVVERSDFCIYQADECSIAIHCGDFFAFSSANSGVPFDALFDRGALVALPASVRSGYARQTDRLLKPNARRLLITLEYDQSIVEGPPFSVSAEEVRRYWPSLRPVSAKDDIDNGPPKFRDAGLAEMIEVVWMTRD
jgi:thiopurine S-methyltransferase